MTETLTTTIKIDNWDEQPTQEHDDGTKTAHAVVTLTDGNDGLRSGLLESVLHYGSDGTSEYAGLIRLEAELDGKVGAFTAIGEGTYDGTTAEQHDADRGRHRRPRRHQRHRVEQLHPGRLPEHAPGDRRTDTRVTTPRTRSAPWPTCWARSRSSSPTSSAGR
jgi:hypothetical protein